MSTTNGPAVNILDKDQGNYQSHNQIDSTTSSPSSSQQQQQPILLLSSPKSAANSRHANFLLAETNVNLTSSPLKNDPLLNSANSNSKTRLSSLLNQQVTSMTPSSGPNNEGKLFWQRRDLYGENTDRDLNVHKFFL